MFKKSIIMGVAAVGAMSLVGTGFAGWVIAKTASHQEQGNVVAYAVSDETLKVETDLAQNQNNKIIFGKPSGYEADPTAWLTPTDDVLVENKSVTVTYTITQVPDGKTANTSFRIKIPVVAETLAVFTVKVGDETLSKVADGYFYKYNAPGSNPTVTISYEWGTAFGSKNPYTYYKQDYTDQLATQAKTNLEALDNAIKADDKFVIDSRSSTAKTAESPSIFADQQPGE